MNGPAELDPLHELWLRMRRALAPWGVRIDAEHLSLWRDQATHGQGPIHAAERGQTQNVEELIALLRLLTGTDEPQAGKGGAPGREG